jgi:probable O-glycosylation ligase (exosortase A-associated)
VKVGLSGVLSGGNITVKQGPGGMLEDNNNFGLALVMALPFLIQITQAERNPVLKRGFLAIVPLTAVAVMATHSRGAFLSMAAAIGVLVWRSKNRFVGFAIAGVLALSAFLMVPDSYKERISSIQDYEQDGSAMGRLAAWQTAINMTKSNPVFGVGFENFQANYWRYASGAQSEGKRVAHNAYFQIMAECGLPAYGLYMFLIVATMLALWRVRKRAEELYAQSWIRDYAVMFEATMVAFIVGSTFLNRAQFDLFYHLVAIVIAFEVIAEREFSGQGEVDGPVELHGGELRPVRRRGFRGVIPAFQRGA